MAVRDAIVLAAGAVACAAAVPVAALTVPAYTVDAAADGRGSTAHRTVVEANGAWVLIPATVPLVAAIAIVLLLHRRCATGSAVALRGAWALLAALGVFVILAAASIGMWMAPAALLLALATAATPAGGAGDGNAGGTRSPPPHGQAPAATCRR
jgi:hypothetical protein